jgi:hypothetical protein
MAENFDMLDAQYCAFKIGIRRAKDTLESLSQFKLPNPPRGMVELDIAREHLKNLIETTSKSLREQGACSQLTITLVRSIYFFDRECRAKYLEGSR